ncbi:hypothetical protein KDA_30060 [Dictyobacter alpinus]|uniref:HNH nuclease domain-containing protein n=1 Tax=Dictyobacter alpinus TaxID=2014873 RepID=A0A402B883_9CHLR|nr:hypothetical protein [Dictyobacter alpinus]GCE27522.1 hypothetical protein KDA_30060 [Dictyobacter alpinus]
MPWKDKKKYHTEEYREYMRNYQRGWHQKKKESRLIKIYERKEELWKFYTQLKEQISCNQCGENHPATLQFHHLEPQKKDFNLSNAVRQGYSIETIKNEIAKCVVLCANCHAKEHYKLALQKKSTFKEGLTVQFQELEQVLYSNEISENN